jgi:hypothetical protein
VIRGAHALSRAFVTAHQRCARAPPKSVERARGGKGPALRAAGAFATLDIHASKEATARPKRERFELGSLS